MKKTKEEIKQWLLKNCIDKKGNLNLSDLDFSDFNGNIYINRMKVKKSLYQNEQKVKINLYQNNQIVEKILWQYNQTVEINIFQDHQNAKRNIFQSYQTVGKDLYQSYQSVKGYLCQINQQVDDNMLMQDNRFNMIKIEIIREDSTIFTLYVDSKEEAKEFVRYFNVNISNLDEASWI